MDTSDSIFEIENLDPKITEKDLKDFFTERSVDIFRIAFFEVNGQSIPFYKTENARIEYDPKNYSIAILEDLEDSVIPGFENKLKFNLMTLGNKNTEELEYKVKKMQEDKTLNYKEQYFGHIKTEFVRSSGDASLTFINENIISKQRGIIGYFLKKIGSNIISGQSIMSISLPINIFDERSLLELFAFQNSLAPYFLDKAGEETGLERLKLTTTYAITMLHLSVTQLKPFNPIWGETFQARIGSGKIYLEQTSHHPPRCHFNYYGNKFKVYGFQEPNATTGTNSISSKSLGYHYVEYPDGGKYRIYGPSLTITGTMYGARTFNYYDRMYVVDEKNDYISVIYFNPDERGFFGKMLGRKSSLPDYIKGIITRKSQCVFNEKDKSFTPNDKHFIFSKIEGEWSDFVKFDDTIYWDYNTFAHYNLQRLEDEFILPSDSTKREDLIILKLGNESEAQKAKVKLEELQRKDRKLRSANGNKHN